MNQPEMPMYKQCTKCQTINPADAASCQKCLGEAFGSKPTSTLIEKKTEPDLPFAFLLSVFAALAIAWTTSMPKTFLDGLVLVPPIAALTFALKKSKGRPDLFLTALIIAVSKAFVLVFIGLMSLVFLFMLVAGVLSAL